MYLADIITATVDSMRSQFGQNHPTAEWRNLRIGIDYPVEKQEWPGMWIGYEPSGMLQSGSVGDNLLPYPEDSGLVGFYRPWTFDGSVSYTIYALSSLERARIYDEVVKVLTASAVVGSEFATYRQSIEANPFVNMSPQWDQIGTRGMSESQGTPWGTEEVIYEVTLTQTMTGDFAADAATGEIVELSKVDFYPYTGDFGDTDPTTGGGWA